jgi:hypothetical protein
MQGCIHLDVRTLTFHHKLTPDALRERARAVVVAMDCEDSELGLVDFDATEGQDRAAQAYVL